MDTCTLWKTNGRRFSKRARTWPNGRGAFMKLGVEPGPFAKGAKAAQGGTLRKGMAHGIVRAHVYFSDRVGIRIYNVVGILTKSELKVVRLDRPYPR